MAVELIEVIEKATTKKDVIVNGAKGTRKMSGRTKNVNK
jgi:hypothetical protein